VETWRTEIPDFDLLLSARQELLHREDQATPEEAQLDTQTAQPSKQLSAAMPDELPTAIPDSSLEPDSSTPAEAPVPSQLSAKVNITAPAESSTPALLRPQGHRAASLQAVHETPGSSTAPSEIGLDGSEADDKEDEASLNHILTNVVILYEFILEITALVQARASVLQDVQFSS
ncbi:hypothetical protein FQN49_004702, partial [Arthroderma sp. PD_2]